MRKLLFAALLALFALPAQAQLATRGALATLDMTTTSTCVLGNSNILAISTSDQGTAGIDVITSSTGTLSFYLSRDGTNFSLAQVFPAGVTSSAMVTSTSAAGSWVLPVASYRVLCVSVSAKVTSGTSTVVLTASPAAFPPVWGTDPAFTPGAGGYPQMTFALGAQNSATTTQGDALQSSGGALHEMSCSLGTPGAPTVLAVGGGVATSTGFTLGKPIRFSCNMAAAYRTGTSTAISAATNVNSNQLPANTVEKLCPYWNENSIGFFSSTTGTCWISTLSW